MKACRLNFGGGFRGMASLLYPIGRLHSGPSVQIEMSELAGDVGRDSEIYLSTLLLLIAAFPIIDR